jgi:hypothetical protein
MSQPLIENINISLAQETRQEDKKTRRQEDKKEVQPIGTHSTCPFEKAKPSKTPTSNHAEASKRTFVADMDIVMESERER